MRNINEISPLDPEDLEKTDGRLEVLAVCVRENPIMLAEHMNLRTAAVICNQSQEVSYEEFVRNGHRIKAYSFAERGVGLNRNNALMRAPWRII